MNYTYFLRDSRDQSIFYVGWTNSLKRRLYEHLYETEKGINTYKCNKIKKILGEGGRDWLVKDVRKPN